MLVLDDDRDVVERAGELRREEVQRRTNVLLEATGAHDTEANTPGAWDRAPGTA
jgi:hypothetical protein